MSKRHKYALTIQTEPGVTDDESVRCLRAFLKAAIRQWGIRCLTAERLDASDDDDNDPQDGNTSDA